ncbi:class I SAM-dependent methyltransferase [Vallicoccus soli]|uniref:Methyltransferase domain-containing protein n=1 Tax=Vallicoccus soli TaxID=2339232 RepID=A0A3A3YVI6_9ACTN|nr:methyltransferase domain-containing protein [Vallicoccus soli]RJK94779.1 methyltransferase domain-containing protein [Vallicoccus soli]
MATTERARVDEGNRAQERTWDGDEGDYWARHADRFDRSVAGYHDGFLAAAGVRPGDRVLDVGCGAGRTTLDAARAAGEGGAVGVDLSSRLLEVARRRARAEGVTGARFVRADAQVHPFAPEAHDLVVSRTGAMFFADPVAAFAGLARTTRPGGRLVLLVWRAAAENAWITQVAGALSGVAAPPTAGTAPGPFSLADPRHVEAVLTAAGWSGVALEPRDAPLWFGEDAEDALRFLLGLFGWQLDGRPAADREAAVDRLRASLVRHEGPRGVRYASAAWLCTARRGPGR